MAHLPLIRSTSNQTKLNRGPLGRGFSLPRRSGRHGAGGFLCVRLLIFILKSMVLSSVVLAITFSVVLGQEAGPLVCWGSNPYGVLDAPDGLFTAVAAGKEHVLAIGLDGSLVC